MMLPFINDALHLYMMLPFINDALHLYMMLPFINDALHLYMVLPFIYHALHLYMMLPFIYHALRLSICLDLVTRDHNYDHVINLVARWLIQTCLRSLLLWRLPTVKQPHPPRWSTVYRLCYAAVCVRCVCVCKV